VVRVDTKREVDVAQYHFDGPFGNMFREMFPDMPSERHPVPGYGSGFILTDDGYVMTNNHVVQDVDRVEVKMPDGRTYRAKVIGSDPSTDVAVLRIETDDELPTVKLGDSDKMRTGDWVLAFGNPFGLLEGSVTAGVVSAKGRSDLAIQGGGPVYQDFIQTDASINFGNSGGPLVNLNGEVIGMNSAINPSGQGIGFAIPINLAKRIAEQLIDHGKVVRGYMGIYPQELTPELAEGKGIEGRKGILVGQVVEDSPAGEAGLEVGDVITEFNGVEVTEVNKFRWIVADTPVGEEVEVAILRDGRKKNVDLVLTERPDAEVAQAVEEAVEEERWLGVEVSGVRSSEAQHMGIDPEEEGVVVIDIEPGSPAQEAGFRPGDIIVEIDNKDIEDLRDYQSARDSLKERTKAIVFLVKRDAFTTFLAVKPENE
jgi:serine protease Do